MITREEYNKALDIVECYHKQLSIDDLHNRDKTKISEWDKLGDCSTRLSKNLVNTHFKYVEDITKDKFLKTRGLAKGSWKEFVKLRGY